MTNWRRPLFPQVNKSEIQGIQIFTDFLLYYALPG